jgi:hypothetical protein
MGRANTYWTFPALQQAGNSTRMLLVWSTRFFAITDSSHPLQALREWAASEDGRCLYDQMAKDVQTSQGPEQLALTTAALMNYRRLCPDRSDDLVRPIKSSYLHDLDALFRGDALGNSGTVAKRMVFALIRVFGAEDRFEGLKTFLEDITDQEPPLLHVCDGLSDQYMKRMTVGLDHDTAFAAVSRELAPWNVPEVKHEGADWLCEVKEEEDWLCEDCVASCVVAEYVP